MVLVNQGIIALEVVSNINLNTKNYKEIEDGNAYSEIINYLKNCIIGGMSIHYLYIYSLGIQDDIICAFFVLSIRKFVFG